MNTSCSRAAQCRRSQSRQELWRLHQRAGAHPGLQVTQDQFASGVELVREQDLIRKLQAVDQFLIVDTQAVVGAASGRRATATR